MPRNLSNRISTARKNYECYRCHNKIAKGSRYQRNVYAFNEDNLITYRFHYPDNSCPAKKDKSKKYKILATVAILIITIVGVVLSRSKEPDVVVIEPEPTRYIIPTETDTSTPIPTRQIPEHNK